MGASGRASLALAALVGAACVTRTERVAPRPGAAGVSAHGTPELIQTIARQALALDAAGDRAADTLYAPDALVVANARVRLAAPRFAGIGYGGRVTVATATTTLEGRFAWVMVDYRWINSRQNQAEAGRATLVCAEQSHGWKIVHAHSSQLLPWDR
ncbi:MAG TPA: nuclear transport factor 2 family protein [Gemmatimonadales bacterium]|nr:nuclear transport factor 2 family protein [Gemmatimonadales bacterium]